MAGSCRKCGAPLVDDGGRSPYCPGCLPDPVPTTTKLDTVEPAGRIGAYRLLQRIGEGGMGEVFLAEQQRPVRRHVALKLIKAGMDTKQVVARFASERQALALMDHPSIAKVFDAGATEQGRPYFAMEYVRGEPITVYCDRHRLDTRERLRLFMRVCDGVQHAHQKGIIHRDLKPSNVLVAIQDDGPVPKIIDFGVAKATQQRLTEMTVHTQIGVLIGTPEYMSPEQAEMTGLDVDTRTDVYALGVMLYELLVGSLPFEASKLREAGFDEIRRKIREDEPPKPSVRLSTLENGLSVESATRRRSDPSTLRKLLRGDLDWITMRCLEKDRIRRYGSPSELAADIGRHLAHEPVAAGPPGGGYRLRKFVRRHRLGVAAGAAVALAVVVALGGIAVGFVRATRAERLARQEAGRANREAQTAQRVAQFLEEMFEVADPYETPGRAITAREMLDRGAARIDRELTDQPLVRARLIGTMGRVYLGLGVLEEAERLLMSAYETRVAQLGPNHRDVADALADLGELSFAQGALESSKDYFARALAVRESNFGRDHETTAISLYKLGAAHMMAREMTQARSYLEEALPILERRLGSDDRYVMWCLNDLGNVFFDQEEYRTAKEYYERALAIREKILDPQHPDLAMGLNNLGNCFTRLGEYAEARQLLERALEINERVLGPDHPNAAWTLDSLGDLLLRDGDALAARSYLERALSLMNASFTGDHPQLGITQTTLAMACHRLGDFDEAEALFRRAEAVLLKTLPPDHPDVERSLRAHAALLRDLGRLDEARRLENRAQSSR